MPNIAKIFKEEVPRVSRREARVTPDRARKSVSRHQGEIAQLKAQVKALERKVLVPEKGLAKSAALSAEETVPKQVRLVPKGLVSTRKRLGLSSADLPKLRGVSAQAIYNWERGTTRPVPALQAKSACLRSAGKRQMQMHLAARQDHD